MKRVAAYVIVVLVGTAPAFFMVLNALFSDSAGPSDDAVALAVTAVAYLVLGIAASLLVRGAPLSTAAALAAAGVVVAALYTLREPSVWPLALIQAFTALVASASGVTLGTRARILLQTPRNGR